MGSSEMRSPVYLSPSALALWEENPENAFLRYIVPKDLRPPKPKQETPMSVGSAFDALVKNRIHKDVYGLEATAQAGYTLLELVKTQCEEHTLPKSFVIACDVFESYVECGAYQNLLDLIKSATPPRMEFDVTATIGGVPLLGKPDLHFLVGGAHVITDWKVSGSCSKSGVSPQQGFAFSLGGTRGNGKCHPKFQEGHHPCGLIVNKVPMNETTDYWADQLATYAWALGVPVGSQDFVGRIEQLACRPCPASDKTGRLRVKSVVHQSTIDEGYQKALLERYQRVWSHVESGHYIHDVSRAESDTRCNKIIRLLSQPKDVAKMSVGTIPEINW